MSPDAYRQQLLAPLRRGAGAARRELAARIWFRPEAREKQVSLEDLYDAGVLNIRVAGAYAGTEPQKIAITSGG